jgi:hypothetical protein
MKVTRKSPGVRGIPPNLLKPAKPPANAAGNVANQPAVYSPRNAVPQMKVAGFAQPPLRPAPPVYRPQNGAPQRKAPVPARPQTGMSPPVYRPRPATPQMKPSPFAKPSVQSVPPVYRPQVSSKTTVAPVSAPLRSDPVRFAPRPALPGGNPSHRPPSFPAPPKIVQRARFAAPPAYRPGHFAAIQARGLNPYASGGGDTSHHIIPHSTLVATRAILTPADQLAVLRMFLPPFDSLTINTLVNAAIEDRAQNPLVIRDGAGIITQHRIRNNDDLKALAATPFSQLSSTDKAGFTFDGASFTAFQAAYNAQKNGGVGAPAPSEKEECMMEAFFEWQSGNQFYGPNRYEPGTSDDFDADAVYVYGQQRINTLSSISGTLKQNQVAPVTAGTQAAILSAFTTLAASGTVGASVPAPDMSQWVQLNSDLRQHLLTLIEGYDRVTASGAIGPRNNAKYVHKGIIESGLKKFKPRSKEKGAGSKQAWHTVFTYIKDGGLFGAAPAALPHPAYNHWQVAVQNKKYLQIQTYEAKVLVTALGIKMDDIWNALDDLFVLGVKEAFGL